MKNIPYKRVDRVNDLVRKIVSEVLLEQMHHRGLDQVTVTAAALTPDFKHAKIFYRVFMREEKEEARLSLIKVLPKIQKAVAKIIHTRYAPKIKFIYDDSLEEGAKIEYLLSQVNSGYSLEEE